MTTEDPVNVAPSYDKRNIMKIDSLLNATSVPPVKVTTKYKIIRTEPVIKDKTFKTRHQISTQEQKYKNDIWKTLNKESKPFILKYKDEKSNKENINKKKDKDYRCTYPNCNKVFSRACVLVRHHNQAHGSSFRPYICDICGESFGKQFYLTRHKKSHNLIKPYHCSRCLKGFTRSDSCLRHIRTTGCKPYDEIVKELLININEIHSII